MHCQAGAWAPLAPLASVPPNYTSKGALGACGLPWAPSLCTPYTFDLSWTHYLLASKHRVDQSSQHPQGHGRTSVRTEGVWAARQPALWSRLPFSPLQWNLFPKGTTAWMPPRPVTSTIPARSTGPPTSPRAPPACPTRSATGVSATRLCGSSSTKFRPSTATGCSSAPAGTSRAPSGGARPSCPCAPTRRGRSPTAWTCRTPARRITSAGKRAPAAGW